MPKGDHSYPHLRGVPGGQPIGAIRDESDPVVILRSPGMSLTIAFACFRSLVRACPYRAEDRIAFRRQFRLELVTHRAHGWLGVSGGARLFGDLWELGSGRGEVLVGMWKIWLGFGRFRLRFGSDLGDAVGIWDGLFGFARFGWDLGDLIGI